MFILISDINIWREISNLTCKKSVGDCNANHVQEDEKNQEDLIGAKFHLTCKALFYTKFDSAIHYHSLLSIFKTDRVNVSKGGHQFDEVIMQHSF